jgi:signal peptidase I
MEGSLLVNDYLFVSKVSYGARTPMTPLAIPLVHNTLPFFNCKSYTELVQWGYHRLPGLGHIERNDVVVFNFPAGDTVALEARSRLLCVT